MTFPFSISVGYYVIVPRRVSYGCFLKWWYPTTMDFPTKNDHFVPPLKETAISQWFISHLVATSRSHHDEELPHHFGPLHQAQLRILLATGGGWLRLRLRCDLRMVGWTMLSTRCQQHLKLQLPNTKKLGPTHHVESSIFAMDFSGATKMMEKTSGSLIFFNTVWLEPPRLSMRMSYQPVNFPSLNDPRAVWWSFHVFHPALAQNTGFQSTYPTDK